MNVEPTPVPAPRAGAGPSLLEACHEKTVPPVSHRRSRRSFVIPGASRRTDVLSSIEGQYDLVYAYHASDAADPWKKYNVAAPPFLNDLTEIDETMGQ